jgi:hypothetical protein
MSVMLVMVGGSGVAGAATVICQPAIPVRARIPPLNIVWVGLVAFRLKKSRIIGRRISTSKGGL